MNKRSGSCCLYIQGLSPSVTIPGCCLSSSQDEQPPERLVGCAGLVGSCAGGAQMLCQARGLWQCLRLAPQHAALSLARRLELSCITKPFARWMCTSSDRSPGRAIAQILAESMASPASGKCNKTIWLFRAQQDSGLCVYIHQLPVLPYKSSCYKKLS